jgi:DNA-binding transcriptional regulator YdaS (Cro superfamily)
MGKARAKRKTPLADWIDASGKTRREVAEHLGLAETSLNRLCNGARRPGIELAFAIEKLTKGKIPAEFWRKIPPHSRD